MAASSQDTSFTLRHVIGRHGRVTFTGRGGGVHPLEGAVLEPLEIRPGMQ